MNNFYYKNILLFPSNISMTFELLSWTMREMNTIFRLHKFSSIFWKLSTIRKPCVSHGLFSVLFEHQEKEKFCKIRIASSKRWDWKKQKNKIEHCEAGSIFLFALFIIQIKCEIVEFSSIRHLDLASDHLISKMFTIFFSSVSYFVFAICASLVLCLCNERTSSNYICTW